MKISKQDEQSGEESMRPGQQNKRGRGRGSNNGGGGGGGGGNNNNNFNRKGANPLTRTYDSSGPDVKNRGTAQHIAEKYGTLARDSHSAGDRVMAENYLQHAEHYNRIILAAQAQMQERFQREDRQDFNDRDGSDRDMDDVDSSDSDMDEQPQMARAPMRSHAPAPAPAPEIIDGTGPQPVIEGTPAEVAIEEEQPAESGQPRQPRRRSAGNRPRRQPRRSSEGGEDQEAPEAPVLAEASE
jgi:hypothetical protein